MLENGRLCVKTCGRDSGKIAVVIDQIDDTYVLVDGQVRRKKCNRMHLEPLDKKIKVKTKATSETVAKELKQLGIDVRKTKPKKPAERPKKIRKVKEKKQEKVPGKEGKKVEKVKEKKVEKQPSLKQPFKKALAEKKVGEEKKEKTKKVEKKKSVKK
ncbi:MAG: 50S ribosomal protein L14e [Candidatus Woesearchaeota archaeon]